MFPQRVPCGFDFRAIRGAEGVAGTLCPSVETFRVATTYHEQFLPPTSPGDENPAPATEPGQILRSEAHQMVRALERAFSQSFAVLDCTTGARVRPATEGLPVDLYKRLAACEEIAQRGRAEILDEVSPLIMVAV